MFSSANHDGGAAIQRIRAGYERNAIYCVVSDFGDRVHVTGAGSGVRGAFIDGDGKDIPGSVRLRRITPKGEVMRFGELPPILGEFESRRLQGDIGQ